MLRKRSEKSAKKVIYSHANIVRNKVFLYSQEYREQKWGKNKRETNFPETHDKCEQKMLGKKIVGKIAKKRFLYSHEYRDLKMGGKRRAK